MQWRNEAKCRSSGQQNCHPSNYFVRQWYLSPVFFVWPSAIAKLPFIYPIFSAGRPTTIVKLDIQTSIFWRNNQNTTPLPPDSRSGRELTSRPSLHDISCKLTGRPPIKRSGKYLLDGVWSKIWRFSYMRNLITFQQILLGYNLTRKLDTEQELMEHNFKSLNTTLSESGAIYLSYNV